MKKMLLRCAAVAAIAGAPLVLAQNAAEQNRETNTPAARHEGQDRSHAMDQQEERKFIQEASSGNNFEIQLSQFVEQKTQDQQVKQLAQQLIKDHQQAEQQLKQVAQSMGAPLKDELMPAQRAQLEEMQQKQGDELDRAYLFCNVGDHHKDILMYSWAERNAQNPQLKQYIEQTVPHLREHLQQTDQAVAEITGINEAQTAGERIRGGVNKITHGDNSR